MKITICGSLTNTPKMLPIIKELEKNGHKCFWSKGMDLYARGNKDIIDRAKKDHASLKQDNDAIKWYYNSIKNTDCILVCNFTKNDIRGYVGGNVLMEIAFAYVLDKKIFMLDIIPEVKHKDEIIAMKPIIINNDLNKIK